MIQSKVCAHPDCDNMLHRPTKTKRISGKQWEARKFCGHSCSAKKRQGDEVVKVKKQAPWIASPNARLPAFALAFK